MSDWDDSYPYQSPFPKRHDLPAQTSPELPDWFSGFAIGASIGAVLGIYAMVYIGRLL